MKIFVLLSFAGCVTVAASDFGSQITFRGRSQFNHMMYMANGYGLWKIFGYGCWCSNPFRKQNVEPKDDIDRCCKNHFNCLKDAENIHGCQKDTVYHFDKPRNKPIVCPQRYKSRPYTYGGFAGQGSRLYGYGRGVFATQGQGSGFGSGVFAAREQGSRPYTYGRAGVVISCPGKICDCDRTAVNCIKEGTFQSKYKYIKTQCRR